MFYFSHDKRLVKLASYMDTVRSVGCILEATTKKKALHQCCIVGNVESRVALLQSLDDLFRAFF